MKGHNRFPYSQDKVKTFSPLIFSTFSPEGRSTFLWTEKLVVSLRGDTALPDKKSSLPLMGNWGWASW